MTDPIDRFKVMNPFADESAAGELDERDTALLHQIMQQHVERPTNRASRSRRPLWLVTAAIATGALATAAFAVLRTEQATVPNAVACHATADTLSDVVGLRGSADPIGACAEVWARGEFGGDRTVPPLAACVNSGGAAAVFPGGADVCDQLGLARLQPGFTDEQQAVVDLEDRLATVFMETCFDQNASVTEAERQLEMLGMTDWTVRIAEDFPEGSPCAAPGVLAAERVVFLAGVRAD